MSPLVPRFRRPPLVGSALAVLVLLAAVCGSPGAYAQGAGARPTPYDHLTITVADSGSPLTDGTTVLRCHPAGGSHPQASATCRMLDKRTIWGRDPFSEVPRRTPCPMLYGGPATAHITGRWAGRPVDAHFSRADGCQVHRWNVLYPLLPHTSSI